MIVDLHGNAEDIAHLAVEVAETALRPGEDAGGDVGQRGQMVGEGAQGDGLAAAGVAGDQGEAALAHQAFEAPAEVLIVEEIGDHYRCLGRGVLWARDSW